MFTCLNPWDNQSLFSSFLSFRDNRSESRGDVGQREREIALSWRMIIITDVTGFLWRWYSFFFLLHSWAFDYCPVILRLLLLFCSVYLLKQQQQQSRFFCPRRCLLPDLCPLCPASSPFFCSFLHSLRRHNCLRLFLPPSCTSHLTRLHTLSLAKAANCAAAPHGQQRQPRLFTVCLAPGNPFFSPFIAARFNALRDGVSSSPPPPSSWSSSAMVVRSHWRFISVNS